MPKTKKSKTQTKYKNRTEERERKKKEKKHKNKSDRKGTKNKQKNEKTKLQDVHEDTKELTSVAEIEVEAKQSDVHEDTKELNSVVEIEVEDNICTEAPVDIQQQLPQDNASDNKENSLQSTENIIPSTNIVEQKENEKKNGILRKLLPGWKTIVKSLFSFVGVFVLLILYIFGGTYWFYDLEKPLEIERQKEMLVQHKEVGASVTYLADFLTDIHYSPIRSYNNCSKYADLDANYVAKGTYSNACLKLTPLEKEQSPFCNCIRIYQEQYEKMALHGINRMAVQLVHAAKIHKYKIGKDGDVAKWENKWTPGNSFLFTISSLTLIGYGHITPSTTSGKLQLVAYIIVGLPLMMVFLSNIGNTMASALKWFYSRIGCRWCRVRRKKSELEAHGFLTPHGVKKENPSVDKPTELVVDQSDQEDGISNSVDNCTNDDGMNIAENIGNQRDDTWVTETEREENSSEHANTLTLSDDNVGNETYMPTVEVSVPIIVTLCIMLTYIVLGALVFVQMEQWKLSDAIYFCFITLTTIGLGDFVPSPSPQNSDEANLAKLIFTSIYCLIGLALISMGISLMQEQVIGKINWCVNEIGLRETEEDSMTKYILTKHYAIVTTPANKNGNKLDIESQFTDLSELGKANDANMLDNSIYFVEHGTMYDEAIEKEGEVEVTEKGNSDDDSIIESCTSDALLQSQPT